ncbi:MAG: hypothetical protein ACFB4J_02580 [Elainellaceae cyanobacterium]
MVVIAPPQENSTVHQTLSTNASDIIALRALVEGLIYYMQSEADVDAKVSASKELVEQTIATLDQTLTDSINLVQQTATANASAIQANVTSLTEQVSRLAATESALSQQESLNQQQQVLIEQLAALSALLSEATEEQASDIVENLFSSQISIGGTSIDLRYLLFFREAIQIYRTSRLENATWPGNMVFSTSWHIPGVGSELSSTGRLYGNEGGGTEFPVLADQTKFPTPLTGPEIVKVVYEVNDAFGVPGVTFEHETMFKKELVGGFMIYRPIQVQDLTYGGGTTVLLGLLVATYGDAVKGQFFPSTAAPSEETPADPDPANA